MELNEIKHYKHKVKIINVHNNNQQSIYMFITVKINLPTSNDETVRFSLEPNDHFLEHQHIIDTNDYYCDIPNNLKQTTTLYAHFFPSDLYTYENELDNLVYTYNLEDIFTEATITSNRYNAEMDERGNLIIQSIDEQSIDNIHNPNYKEYSKTNNNNKTEQGFFPLSSKYRTKQNWEVPHLNESKPYWRENSNNLFWEARIPTEYAQSPMKVFINYEYLPTSREYHQHYFGFEGIIQNDDTINVFEGTNINTLDNKFGSDNNYRLINLGNPYSDKRSIYVPHENIIPINLNEFTAKTFNNQKTCEWHKNKCQDYYIYTPLYKPSNEDGYCLKTISLVPGQYYSLRYYIYIPSYANVEIDKCYIVIETEEKTYQLNENFIAKDKEMRNKWIYHEIPFLATEKNYIKIIGPQTISENNKDNSIYFIDMSLYQMVEYTPTLQYTNTGLRISEEDQQTLRLISDANTTKNIQPDDKRWTPNNKQLPTPYNEVYINVDDEEEVYYEQFSSDLIYTHTSFNNNEQPVIDYDQTTTDLTLRTNDNVSLTYDSSNHTIYAEYNYKMKGVYGPNNNFTFNFVDDTGNPITSGEVIAGIFLERDSVLDINASEKKLSYNPVPVQGQVTFSNIDLTYLQPNNPISNKYYIRLDYTNPCSEKKKTVFKTLYLYKEDVIIDNLRISNIQNTNNSYITDISINENTSNLIVNEVRRNDIHNTEIVNDLILENDNKIKQKSSIIINNTDEIIHGAREISIDNGDLYINFDSDEYEYSTQEDILKYGYTIYNINQLPLKIEARIVDQNYNLKTVGYCELSIDDTLNQTTIVDNGWVDFYINAEDLKPGCQTIKIEYYREYFKSLGFIYFNICVDNNLDFTKNYVPIDIKIFNNGTIRSLPIRTFEDKGIKNKDNDHYYNTSSLVDRDTKEDGTTLSNTRATNTRSYYPVPNEYSIISGMNLNMYMGDCTIDLDLIEYSGNSYIGIFGDGITSFYRSWSNLRCVGGEHIKIVNKNNTQSIFIDNEKTPRWTKNNIYNLTPYNIRFVLSVGTSLKFKNLKIVNHPYYKIDADDTTLNVIDTINHSKYRIEIYKDNNLMLKQNIGTVSENISFLSHEFGDTDTHLFTIKTGNMLDNNNEPIEDLYYDYEKKFLIQKDPT